ncbi:hypothetical protein SMICM304S_12221 [Streptomyces microflavus]
MPTAAAFGPTDPSGRRSSVASGACQPPPPLATRTGTTDCSRVKVKPSGFANTVVRSERSPTTSTRLPEATASARALPPSLSSPDPAESVSAKLSWVGNTSIASAAATATPPLPRLRARRNLALNSTSPHLRVA